MEGFVVGEFMAIPYGKKGYIIVHKGAQMERVCRTEKTARAYIADLKKAIVPPKKSAQAPRRKRKKDV